MPIDTFVPVRVLLSPALNHVPASLKLAMFYSEFTIWDVAPESAINVSISCSWFDVLAINRQL